MRRPAQKVVEPKPGFPHVYDRLTDIIKQLANEPSVGLFFVQQHVQRTVPIMVGIKKQLQDSTNKAVFDTQDAKSATGVVKVMKNVGPAALDRILQSLEASASTMVTSHQSSGTWSFTRDSAARGSHDGTPSVSLSPLTTNEHDRAPLGEPFPAGKTVVVGEDGIHGSVLKTISTSKLGMSTISDYRSPTGYMRAMLDAALLKPPEVGASRARPPMSPGSAASSAASADMAADKRASSPTMKMERRSSGDMMKSVMDSIQKASITMLKKEGARTQASGTEPHAEPGEAAADPDDPPKQGLTEKSPANYMRAMIGTASSKAGQAGSAVLGAAGATYAVAAEATYSAASSAASAAGTAAGVAASVAANAAGAAASAASRMNPSRLLRELSPARTGPGDGYESHPSGSGVSDKEDGGARLLTSPEKGGGSGAQKGEEASGVGREEEGVNWTTKAGQALRETLDMSRLRGRSRSQSPAPVPTKGEGRSESKGSEDGLRVGAGSGESRAFGDDTGDVSVVPRGVEVASVDGILAMEAGGDGKERAGAEWEGAVGEGAREGQAQGLVGEAYKDGDADEVGSDRRIKEAAAAALEFDRLQAEQKAKLESWLGGEEDK